MISRNPGHASEYALINLDSGVEIAARVSVARDSASRRKGLLGVAELERGSGLWIMPCEAIHTFGMKMPIDVIFLDRDFRVRKLLAPIAPRRLSVCLRASSVVEMRAGTLAESRTKVGDRVAFERTGQGYQTTAELPMSPGSTCHSF